MATLKVKGRKNDVRVLVFAERSNTHLNYPLWCYREKRETSVKNIENVGLEPTIFTMIV